VAVDWGNSENGHVRFSSAAALNAINEPGWGKWSDGCQSACNPTKTLEATGVCHVKQISPPPPPTTTQAPPPPPPTTPAPPVAVAEATRVVKMAVSLPMSVDDFDQSKQDKFVASIARAADVATADVNIDKIEAITVARRRLLAESIRVETSIKAADQSAAAAMADKLTASTINTELAKEGLPDATIIAAPTVEAVATSATDSETTGLSAGALAGIIVGATVAVGAIGAGAYFYSQSPQKAPNTQGAIHANQGPSVSVPPSVQPAIPQTAATAPSTTIDNNANLAALVPGAQAAGMPMPQQQPAAAGSRFCGHCGTPVTKAFCGTCGNPTSAPGPKDIEV